MYCSLSDDGQGWKASTRLRVEAVVALLMRVAGIPGFEAGGVVAGTLGLEVPGTLPADVAGVGAREVDVAGTLGLEVAGTLVFDVASELARVDATLPVLVLMILELPPVDATPPVLVLMILVAEGGTTSWSHLYAES